MEIVIGVVLILITLLLLLVILVGIFYFIDLFLDLPYVATQKHKIETIIKLAQIKKGLQGVKASELSSLATMKLARVHGCKECNETGYKGRIGLFEVMLVGGDTEEFILQKPAVSALRKFAIAKGMTSVYQDGLLKIIQGLTTLEEVVRTTGREKS